jgi:hypothetical protein
MASSKRKKSSKRVSAPDGSVGLVAAEDVGMAIPDFDPIESDRLLNDVALRLCAMSRRAGQLATELESLVTGGSLSGLSQAQAPSGVAEEASALVTEVAANLPSLERVASTIQRWALGERRTRRARFAGIARQRGWVVVGAWPEPVVEGIVFIRLDEDRNRASVNGRPLQGNPTAERIAAVAAHEIEELLKHRSDPESFAADCWAAFRQAAVPVGEGIDVHRLLREILWLKQTKGFRSDPRPENFRPYSAAQFRADLTHYLASGSTPFHDGGKSYQLEAVGGSFAQDAIFMYFPQAGRLASCGRLTFRAVELGGDR